MAFDLMKKGALWLVAAGLCTSVALISNSALSLTAEDGKPANPAPPPPQVSREGNMTLDQIRSIVKRLDENAKEPRAGALSFVVNDFQVALFSSVPMNRMRVMVRIRSAEGITKEDLLRIAQANLDSALDARYAIGQGILWATYIHPLSSLHPKQFIEAIGSTVNLAANYGTTYSSGQLFFGGGDSRGIIGRKLIDELIKKGQPI
ncbi:MAG: hypothetical protein ABJM86_09310 [Hyphomicrobiales bacterium]